MKRKMFAALALSATLAMGAVPAFAADADMEPGVSTETKNFKDDNNKASTVVSVKTDASQISAIIPMKMTVVADANGGSIKAPSAEAYKVTNNSSFDVYITSVKGVEKVHDDWQLISNAQAGNASGGTIADISLKIGKMTADGTAIDAATQTTVSTSETAISGAKELKVGAVKADDVNANVLGIAVEGSTTKASKVNATAVDVIGLEYTISAQKPASA